MRILDLFAGIGGFSLAAHWAGLETAAFVEWNPFCQKVLAKNFPGVPIYGDITKFDYEQEKDAIGPIDIVCGGPPCQGWSISGKQKAFNDPRDGWRSFIRVVSESGAKWFIAENSPEFIRLGFDTFCLEMGQEGFAVGQPLIIPAVGVNAPHLRYRAFIYGNSSDTKCLGLSERLLEFSKQATINIAPLGWPSPEHDNRPTWDCSPRDVLVAYGLSSKLDESATIALGNAVVPQIPYIFFEVIKAITENSK